MVNDKERLRRERIKASLTHYFLTEQGNIHKKHLSVLQAKRMAKYNEFLKKYNNEEDKV